MTTRGENAPESLEGRRRVNWGGGARRHLGWINADTADGPEADINCDIVIDGLPLESDSVDCAYGQHPLQRLSLWDLWSALRELHRVLKPGAALRLGLVDLDLVLEAYCGRRYISLQPSAWQAPGGLFVSRALENGYIQTPLTFGFVEEVLQSIGFDEIRRSEYQATSTAYPELVALDRRPHDSFYVEASKRYPPAEVIKAEPGPARQVHLSWSDDPATTLTITWNTCTGRGPGLIEYRTSGSTQWRRASAVSSPSPGPGVLRRGTVRQLDPATSYEYRVTADQGGIPDMSEVFETRTAPCGPADFSFAFICDTGLIGRHDGNATGTAQIIRELLREDLLFVLGGGDYAYANRDRRYPDVGRAVDAWFMQMEPLIARCPFMAQYGNHEVLLTERLRDWAPRLAHPAGADSGKCYSFDVGDAHFASLFAPCPAIKPEHLLWLDADLLMARQRGSRWLIVFQHEPIYGHGHSHPAQPQVRRVLAPLLEKHRVDLHLSGHDQSFERSYPLRGVPANPMPASFAPHSYRAGDGVIYAKVSPGGKLSNIRNDFSRFTDAQQFFIAVGDDRAHHYMVVSVRQNGELQATTYAVVGDGTPKSVIDRFRILAAEADGPSMGGHSAGVSP